MIDRIFGWGKEHGRLTHILVQAGLQIAIWSLLFAVVSVPSGLTIRLYRQDFPILLLGSAVLLMAGLRGGGLTLPPSLLSGPVVALMAVAVLAIAGAGTWLVFHDFPLTRDEIMADFDAGILATGRLIGTPPAGWLPYLDALMPQFMLDVPSYVGWMSSYLPGNAALRALGARTVGMEWVNPLLAALSVLALFAIGRRLWPQDSFAASVAALLAATSAQVLAMAMTPYAMTAHLAFNLLWLWSFTRNDRRGDACAIVAGFVATGLHQLVFHPLFVAPFIFHMWLRGEWRRALWYVLAYAAIGLFWVSYWQFIAAPGDIAAGAASATGLTRLINQVVALISNFSGSSPLLMGFNLLRFVAWQNLLLIPLVVAAWPAIRDDEGIARPLAAGALLTLVAMLVLLPWQGLGWGYRYLHGVIGSFCLLAGYGWRTLSNHGPRRGFVLAVASAISMFVIVPIQLWHAHDYAAPRARAFAAANNTDADIVLIVPAEDVLDDFVRNAPDLSNHPKMMDLRRLSPQQIDALCRTYSVAYFDLGHSARAGFPEALSRSELQRYSGRPERLGCAQPFTDL